MELLTSSTECDLTPSEKEALFSELSTGILSIKDKVTEQFGANSLSRIEVTQIIESILVVEAKIGGLRRAAADTGLCLPTLPPQSQPVSKPGSSGTDPVQTSCYGSYTTSPTPSTATGCHQPAGAAPDSVGAKHVDLDSGCGLGSSDRSCGTRKTQRGGRGTRGQLSNVEEERSGTGGNCGNQAKALLPPAGSSSSLPSDYVPPTTYYVPDYVPAKPALVAQRLSLDICSPGQPASSQIVRQTFNSLTDLSSEERIALASKTMNSPHTKMSNEVIEKELERMMTTSSSRDVTPRKVQSEADKSNSLRLKPPTPPSTQRSPNTPSGGSTMILAQQIDQEISELRSVFEGHREEMLSLLETAPQLPPNPATRNPIQPFNVTVHGTGDGSPKVRGQYCNTRQNTSLPANMPDSEEQPLQPVETESDCGLSDRLKLDRKKEFEKRRQSVQNRRKKVQLHQKACQSVTPKFDVGGQTTNPISPKSISQFFPLKNASITQTCDDHEVGGGRVVATAGGDQVFIPNLNLEWSECSNVEPVGAAAANKQQQQLQQLQDSYYESFEQTKRRWKSVSSVGTQVDPPNLTIVKASNLTVAKSMLDIVPAADVSCQTDRETPDTLSQLVVTNNRHNHVTKSLTQVTQMDQESSTQASSINETRLRNLMSRDSRLAASLGSHLDGVAGENGSTVIVVNAECCNAAAIQRPQSQTDEEQKSKSLSRKSQSKKNKKELRELLASLNQANEMACRLKQRSEDILTTLKEEMLRIQQPETTGAS